MPAFAAFSSRRSIGAAIAAALLLASGCTSSESPVVGPGPRGAENAVPGTLSISYAGAGNWLRGRSSAESTEQLRDWTRTAVATNLGLSADEFSNASYDTFPVRDQSLAELATQPTGPGRSLLDGDGVLHLLVPRGDRHEKRTVGLLLDQHRTDQGQDAAFAQVDHYDIEPDSQSITVVSGPRARTDEVRTANGYQETPLLTEQDLAQFLEQTSSLSRLEKVGSELIAGGWQWPAPAGARVDASDVSVLQAGYADPDAPSLPGFSLDPHPVTTVADLRAQVPDLSADLARRIIHDRWKGSGFTSARELYRDVVAPVTSLALRKKLVAWQKRALARAGLPKDPTQLWALGHQLTGSGAYSQARYDGGLAGTQVGMTLFYTDYVAKNWVGGIGSGVPSAKVTGFEPMTRASTPLGQCTSSSESGRLWFGQNDAAFRSSPTEITLGAQPTRLFSRSDSTGGGGEVQPSFRFGRSLDWWDQNFEAVADYEPQYQRLDQIMRWSGALDWLAGQDAVAWMPTLAQESLERDLTFATWFSRNRALRERQAIAFVKPPSAKQESISHIPSLPYTDCRSSWIAGGVSLGDRRARLGAQTYEPTLPGPVQRAGNIESSSTYDPATGAGRITQVSIGATGTATNRVERVLSRSSEGHHQVTTVADARTYVSIGGLRVSTAATVARKLTVDLAVQDGAIAQRVRFQDSVLGDLVVRRTPEQMTVTWSQGPLDRMRTSLEGLQKRYASWRSGPLPEPVEGVLYRLQTPQGPVYRTAGGAGDDGYFSVRAARRARGSELALRLGVPGRGPNSPLRYRDARVIAVPEPSSDWIRITPGTGRQAALASYVTGPRRGEQVITASRPDGSRVGSIHLDDQGGATVAAADPAFGQRGTGEGAAVLTGLAQVRTAAAQARKSADGLHRVVPLEGDVLALVGSDTLILPPPGHPWRAQLAGESAPSPAMLVRIEGTQLLRADTAILTAAGAARPATLADLLTGDVPVYVNEHFRSTLAFHDGPLISTSLDTGSLVSVRPFTAGDQAHLSPDLQVQAGTQWWHVGAGSQIRPTATSTPEPTGSGASATGAPAQILLVCPAGTTPTPAACAP